MFLFYSFRQTTSRVSKTAAAPAKKPVQSKMMGRIKFGSDDEADAAPAKEETTTTVVEEKVETVKFEQKDDDGNEVRIGKRTSRLCKYFRVF